MADTWTSKVGMRKPQRRMPLGLMQVLSDDHPLVKYGSWDNVPEAQRFIPPTVAVDYAHLPQIVGDMLRGTDTIDAVNAWNRG